MSLSDPFCVDRHKDSFLNLVKNKLDIIFANEKEAMSLIDAKNFDEVIEFGKSLNKLFIVTRSDKGSIAIKGGDIFEAQAKSNLKIVDLTVAGELFSAGFLQVFGYQWLYYRSMLALLEVSKSIDITLTSKAKMFKNH